MFPYAQRTRRRLALAGLGRRHIACFCARMKKAALILAVLTLASCMQPMADGDQQETLALDSAFLDHSDDGSMLHVLPAHAALVHGEQPVVAPSNAAGVYPPSYGFGPLVDHNGDEIANAAVQQVYWNGSIANGTSTSLGYANIAAQESAFLAAFGGGVADYDVIEQYGSTDPIASTFAAPAAFVDAQATQSSISDRSIRSYLTSLFHAGKLSASSSTVFDVFFPPGMRVRAQGGGSCTSFCAYHSHFSYGGVDVKYAVEPYPGCSGCSLAGKSAADMLTMFAGHEIREAVTDADGSAWFDATGDEADDKCAWHNLYSMSSGGFFVQPEYSDAAGGCVVP
jgi:hypothetical protein